MIFRRFLYGIKEGTRNIFRNKMFSLASLGTIIACVFLLGTFLSVALNVRSTMQQMEQSVGISVFFEPGISTERKDQIGEEIKKKEDIATMRYVSAEEAWESYKKDVFQGNEELLEGFEGNNPLKESDSYDEDQYNGNVSCWWDHSDLNGSFYFPREQYSVYWSCSQRRGNFNYEADRCGEWIY